MPGCAYVLNEHNKDHLQKVTFGADSVQEPGPNFSMLFQHNSTEVLGVVPI